LNQKPKKLDLKVQKLDLKVQKLDLKAQKLDLKAQKRFFGISVEWSWLDLRPKKKPAQFQTSLKNLLIQAIPRCIAIPSPFNVDDPLWQSLSDHT